MGAADSLDDGRQGRLLLHRICVPFLEGLDREDLGDGEGVALHPRIDRKFLHGREPRKLMRHEGGGDLAHAAGCTCCASAAALSAMAFFWLTSAATVAA